MSADLPYRLIKWTRKRLICKGYSFEICFRLRPQLPATTPRRLKRSRANSRRKDWLLMRQQDSSSPCSERLGDYSFLYFMIIISIYTLIYFKSNFLYSYTSYLYLIEIILILFLFLQWWVIAIFAVFILGLWNESELN